MIQPLKDRWCVKHRDGWCAVKNGKKPSEAAFSVPVKCKYHVTLPWGIERRLPDCPECLEVLRARRKN